MNKVNTGELFPGVIARVDHHDKVTGELKYTTYEATFNGEVREYNTWDAAAAWIRCEKVRAVPAISRSEDEHPICSYCSGVCFGL